MAPITCIADLKALYRRRVPGMFYDYAESGSYTERTFAENSADFAQIRFRQKVARDLSDRSVRGRMLGRDVAMPVAIAPVGMLGMQRADGELKAARAARDFGIPFTLSTMSIASIEDVAAATQAPFWFQLYVMRDEDFVDALIERARAAGCSALVVTLDLQVLGQRHRDIKNGLSAPPKPTLKNLVDMSLRTRWGLEMLQTRRHSFGNIVGHAKGVTDVSSLSRWTAEQFDPRLDWDKVARIRDRWGGKLILKGVLDRDDAVRAAELGADAVVVSNHGGRQLDGAPSTIRVLPGIVEAVAGRSEVWLDSGIRSGQDVARALAMGATGTMIGRSMVYALGAMGEEGVAAALKVITAELDITMALMGGRDLSVLNREALYLPDGFLLD